MDQLLGSKYTIGEQIGRGGMGQVFRGSIRETGEPVAVKLLKPELLSDPDIVTRFSVSARSCSRPRTRT